MPSTSTQRASMTSPSPWGAMVAMVVDLALLMPAPGCVLSRKPEGLERHFPRGPLAGDRPHAPQHTAGQIYAVEVCYGAGAIPGSAVSRATVPPERLRARELQGSRLERGPWAVLASLAGDPEGLIACLVTRCPWCTPTCHVISECNGFANTPARYGSPLRWARSRT